MHAAVNPLRDDSFAFNGRELVRLEVVKVMRDAPYYSAEVAVLIPKSRCLLRLSASNSEGEQLMRGEQFWAVIEKRLLSASRNHLATNSYAWFLEKKGICASARLHRLFSGQEDRSYLSARHKVSETIYKYERHQGLLFALILGERHKFSRALRVNFAQLGIGHILAISGLHISILASWAYLLMTPLCWLSPRYAGSARHIAALGICALYAWLSGFDPPVQRAVCALFLFVIVRQFIASIELSRLFVFLLFMVIVIEPQMLMHPSAQASYFAIGVIVLFFHYRWRELINDQKEVLNSPQDRLRKVLNLLWVFFKLQLVLSLSMAWFFYLTSGEFSPYIPLANILIVPLFITALPLAFGWFLFAFLGWDLQFLELLSAKFFDAILFIVHIISELPQTKTYRPSALSYLISLLLLLLVGGRRTRYLFPMAILAIVSIYMPRGMSSAKTAATLHILDVGQGSAAIIENENERWLIDTGTRYQTGFNAGDYIINPILKDMRTYPSQIILSHDDRDHTGGYEAIIKYWGGTNTIGVNGDDCAGTRTLTRTPNSVRVHFFSFPRPRNDNDSSCIVLLIANDVKVLIPGDIEIMAEHWLVEQLEKEELLPLDVLVVSHHGSGTSSSQYFLERTQPELAIISRSLYNSYGHPHDKVLERLDKLGIYLLDTACDGGISLELEQGATKLVRSNHWQQSNFVNEYKARKCRA